jgi:hypothetical protein
LFDEHSKNGRFNSLKRPFLGIQSCYSSLALSNKERISVAALATDVPGPKMPTTPAS